MGDVKWGYPKDGKGRSQGNSRPYPANNRSFLGNSGVDCSSRPYSGGIFRMWWDDHILPSPWVGGLYALSQGLHAGKLAGEHDVVMLARTRGHHAHSQGYFGNHIDESQRLVRRSRVGTDLAKITRRRARRDDSDWPASDIADCKINVTQVSVGGHSFQGVEPCDTEQMPGQPQQSASTHPSATNVLDFLTMHRH